MSEWKESGIRKRDFKHDHSGPESVGGHKKKDTRKWCKGKQGIEHDFLLSERISGRWGMRGIDIYRCKHCGKKRYERCDL